MLFRHQGERVEGGIYSAVQAWCDDPDAAKQLYGPIASWDTSEITKMSLLFTGLVPNGGPLRVDQVRARFNGDISRWDVSSVTDMNSMLEGATSFNGDLSQWDVSNVTHMGSMLYGATSFNCNLSQWDLSKVRDMSFMLYSASSFTHQLGGAWSTSTADKTRMFHNCPGSIAGKTNDANGTPE